jgi:mycothiol synthase
MSVTSQTVRIESLSADWPSVLPHFLSPPPENAVLESMLRRCLSLLMTARIDPHGVWIARAGERVVGMQVCVPLAGAACLFWLPAGAAEIADQLAAAGVNWARSTGCKIAQATVAIGQHAVAVPLLRCGFRPIARLRHMSHNLAQLPIEPTSTLRFMPLRPSLLPTFTATLERTYDDTLDCPELNGIRTIDEILAGHREQGKYDPDFWWLALDGDKPAGVVMLVQMPDLTTWELAYIGLVPEYRGQRLGRVLALRALHAVQALPATGLLLAVDERNSPALRLYRSLGFVEGECNDVLMYFFT